ncbi:hypothetical protein GOP47_0008703 [Adiantum capillus-veneris]|uniref:Bidirectional sugar transporter SWEET n=1 Tax=Adiantum capillus-veneris TaxID=13818 RepID=A0A9D4UZT5_ADICA|nr:hypothetical protein GOP47_0008703 [Adiantum capillus-veneris]
MALLVVVLGVLGNITAFVGLISPMILRNGRNGSYSSQPYLSSLLAALLWTYYGILNKHGGIFVVTISALNCAFQIFYLGIYLCYGTSPQRKKTLIILVLIILFYTGMILSTLLAARNLQRIVVVGTLCIIASIFSTAAPLTIMHKVVTTRSVEFMPLGLSLGLFLNGACWLAYSIATHDMFLLIPNAIGVVLSTIQLVLYTLYRIYGKYVVKRSGLEAENTDKDIARRCDIEENDATSSTSSRDVELAIHSVIPSKDFG